MDTIKFSDGIEFNTNTPYLRVERKLDGFYVVGRNMLIPVDSYKEGDQIIDSILDDEGHSSR